MGFFNMLRGRGEPAEAEQFDDSSMEDYSDAPVQETAEDIPPAYAALGPTVLVRAEPRAYRDVGDIVDCLRRGQPVVVSLEQIELEEAQRIRDFLRGAVYALDGDMQRVASRVLVCLPKSMRYKKLAPQADQPPPHAAAFQAETPPDEESVGHVSESYLPEQWAQQ